MKRTRSAVVAGAGFFVLLSGQAAAREVVFYAANGCRGAPVFAYRGIANIAESCKWNGARCRQQNDVARSAMVRNWSRPLSIFVYDSPDGRETDDWATIQFRTKPAPRNGNVCIPSFESSRSTATVTQVYARKNGLDGKVSFVRIRY